MTAAMSSQTSCAGDRIVQDLVARLVVVDGGICLAATANIPVLRVDADMVLVAVEVQILAVEVQILAVARHERAKLRELTTAIHGVLLWQQQGKRREALERLAISGWSEPNAFSRMPRERYLA
jgi:hypothetical protein